jgi:aldehyde dehydrogenase (NAD+)
MAIPENKLAFGDGWQYSPAPESIDHIKVRKKYDLFIGGDFVAPVKGRYFETINPATEERLSRVGLGTELDVDKAVAAARKAYSSWSRMKAAERGKYVYRIARILQERAREFAAIESLDGGKPIRESRDVDIPLAAAHFFYYAGWADKLDYAFPGRTARPLGVAGQIIPWNFPLLMAAWKIAPALACGNTVVLKPAETTPLTAMKLAEVVADAGLPPGVVNIVTGAGDTGAAIVNHPGVDKIAFTGSTAVGRWPARTRDTRSNSAVKPPISFSPMRRSIRRLRGSSTASSSTRAMFAVPAPDCSYRNRWPIRSSRNSKTAWTP